MPPPTLPKLSSLGHELSTDPEHFGFIEPSNHLLDNPAAMNDQLDEHGYLYFKNFLDSEMVLEARRSILSLLEKEGLLDPHADMMDGIVDAAHLEDFVLETAPKFEDGTTLRKMKAGAFRPDLAKENAAISRVVYGQEMQEFYDNLFGEPGLHFDFTWLRIMGPGLGTPTHCDWVYMGRGSHELLTCWIPYGEVPLEVGGLILLEKSHHQAGKLQPYLNKDVDAYCENRPGDVKKVKEDGGWSFPGWLSKRPDSLPQTMSSRWLTCECWEPGDFITFNMRLVHGSLDNRSNRVRISTDVRYQPASQPADERWIGANPPGHSSAGKLGKIC